jgi:hypothetical protein
LFTVSSLLYESIKTSSQRYKQANTDSIKADVTTIVSEGFDISRNSPLSRVSVSMRKLAVQLGRICTTVRYTMARNDSRKARTMTRPR